MRARASSPTRGNETRRRHEATRGECHHPGCLTPTTGKKPYCLDHLENIPYVQKLMAELERREADARRARERDEVDTDGPSASDILHQLSVHGPLTAGRLAREVELSPDQLGRFLRALEQRGRVAVQVVRDERGKRHRVVKLAA